MVHQKKVQPVVFVAVRGTTTIRTSSGALGVAGAARVSGASTSAFVFPQDRVRILFSGAAFSGPFAGSGLWRCRVSVYRRFRRRIVRCSLRSNRKPPLGKNIRICDIAQPLAPKPFFITQGTPMPSLPKPKKGLGGSIGPDGSVKVDI